MTLLVIVLVPIALLPVAMIVLNWWLYRPPDRSAVDQGPLPQVSVLIPARNEEGSIGAAIASVLQSRGVELELLVMDDQSTDRTASLVRTVAASDPRVRLISGDGLPPGWCGKPHACHGLARQARHPWLVFMDADVRLAEDGLVRMIRFSESRGVDLASGVPRQEFSSWSDRLLIPLIHYVLLGYLPIPGLRWSKRPAFAAGCGQLIIARAEAYWRSGGHEAVRETLHDGIALPRAFRRAGCRTDLFDGTDVAVCRMYRTDGEVWRGLARNAGEGLGSKRRILPMTVLLGGGQVLPFVLLPGLVWWFEPVGQVVLALTAGAIWFTRLGCALRFRQPLWSAWLHPVGMAALVGIQWWALVRACLGRPAVWKDREYRAAGKGSPAPLLQGASNGFSLSRFGGS